EPKSARWFALVVVLALVLPGGPARADESSALYKQGIALKGQGRIDDAIAKFEAVVAASPRHGMAWASLGHLYKKQQRHDKAVDAYERATGIITKDATLWANLGMAYYRAKRVPDAA